MARETYISPQTFVVFKEIGVAPTIPDPPTLRKYHADFRETDLEIGNWARNIADGKLWYRNESGIIELDDDLFGPGINAFHNHDARYYTKDGMPVASAILLGCIKVGANLSMDGEVLNASGVAGGFTTEKFSLAEEAGILYLRCGTLIIFSYDSN